MSDEPKQVPASTILRGEKPRLRVPAVGRDAISGKVTAKTNDSFQNFAANLGYGTRNLSTYSTYGFNPISRIQTKLEWMYRGSWLVGVVVDCVAEDMVRAGIELTGDIKPEDIDEFHQLANATGVWNGVLSTLKWGRLYGGAIGVMMIDGQDPSSPLRIETIKKGAFRGIAVLDRWSLTPSLDELVTELGPDSGMPMYYKVAASMPVLANQKIHYSRILRTVGVELPYWQAIAENMWGMSVLERLYDRLIAFDSTTQGAAQLVYKAHIRTYMVEGLREIIVGGGQAYQGLLEMVKLMRLQQSNEGITLMDAKDKFEAHQYSFSGLADVLLQFGQQLSGATQIPLVRLFGQSPAGLNSTGESDLRNYYDGISQKQESTLRRPLTNLLAVMWKSLGRDVPKGFAFEFNPLWQLSDTEKADIAEKDQRAISGAVNDGIIDVPIALRELRQSSRVTGRFSNITDEDISAAEAAAPNISELGEASAEGLNSKSDEEEKPENDKKPAKTSDSLSYARMWDSLDVIIENPKGSIRVGPNWKATLAADYGYVRGATGADGDQVDCFVGPSRDSDKVFVIDQKNLDTGEFDEHKVMLGFRTKREALQAYVDSYSDDRGYDRIGGVLDWTSERFKNWLTSGSTHEPLVMRAASVLRAVRG